MAQERTRALNAIQVFLEEAKLKLDIERVVLFGSHAIGYPHEWSDIDLLIIKETARRPIERNLELFRLIQPKIGTDIFIYTPEEYEYLLKEKFSFLLSILKTGKTVYEKRS